MVLFVPKTPDTLVVAADVEVPDFEASCKVGPSLPVCKVVHPDVSDVGFLLRVGNEVFFVGALILSVIQDYCIPTKQIKNLPFNQV